MGMIARALPGLLAVMMLAACASTPAESPSPAPALVSTATGVGSAASSGEQAVLTRQVAATPTPGVLLTSAAEDTRADLVIWWPVTLSLGPNSAGEEILIEQLDGFRDAQAQTLHVRTKRLEGAGGIMSTLRTASAVAPAALPDLTLLPRENLIVAAETGLIYPLDGLLPTPLADNLYSQALALGRVDGTLYGVAYLLQIQHIVYRESLFATPPTTPDAVLAAGQPFAFPAGRESGVSDTFLLQYLAAGGRVADEDGRPLLDEQPLRDLLAFYEQAVAQGLVGPEVLNDPTVADYWDDFLRGTLSLAVVDSTTYLASRDQLVDAVTAPIPTADETAYTVLSGWLWVITTPDPDRQAQAIAFLDWIMRPEHQAAFTQAFGMLPSQPDALSLWNPHVYNALVARLLSSDSLILAEETNAAAAMALQEALTAVLRGERTAAEAAADAVAALQ